jgi:hypothetical protein
MADNSTTDLLQVLSEVELQVAKLKARLFKLEVENRSLQDKVFEHLKTISDHKLALAESKEGIAVQHLTKDAELKTKKLTKQTLDKYIKLIDKAIAELQQ